MVAEMTERERVMAAVKGKPVDRVPVSFYRENHTIERSPESIAIHLLKQNRSFGWDFIKVQLSSTYYGEAWGCKYRWNSASVPVLDDYVIKTADDFRKLRKLDPTTGILSDQVRVARLLGENVKGKLVYVQTVFSPLAVAAKLAGSLLRAPTEAHMIKRFMNEKPDALHYGLSVISQTLADYAREVIRAGAEGMFLTTHMWSRDVLTEEEYTIFGRPYDLPIFEAALEEGANFNILHICRENIMLDLFSDYPVQVINYDVRSPRNPSLKEAIRRTDKAFWGGLGQKTTLLTGPAESITAEVHSALEQTGGRRFILGPG